MKYVIYSCLMFLMSLNLCIYAGNDAPKPEEEFVEVIKEGPEPEGLQQTRVQELLGQLKRATPEEMKRIKETLYALGVQASEIGSQAKEVAATITPTGEQVQSVMEQLKTWYGYVGRFAQRILGAPSPVIERKVITPFAPKEVEKFQPRKVAQVPPKLPVRFSETFEQLFTKDSNAESQMTSFKMNEKFNEFLVQLPSLGFKTLSELIEQQQKFIMDQANNLNKQIRSGGTTLEQAKNELTFLYEPLIRLYYVIAVSLTSRFDATHIYKGGLSYDKETYLSRTKFSKEDYDALTLVQGIKESTHFLLKQLINPLDEDKDLYERVQNLYLQKAFFRVDPGNINSHVLLNWLATTFEQKMEPEQGIFEPFKFYFLFHRLQKYRDSIKKSMPIYQNWINYYPALSSKESPLERSWKDHLQKQLKNNQQVDEAMQGVLGIVLRSHDQRTGRKILEKIATTYNQVTKRKYEWPMTYTNFSKMLEENYQQHYAHIQEIKRSVPVNQGNLKSAVQEALRYKFFIDYQSFLTLKTELLSEVKVVKPIKEEPTQEELEQKLEILDEEISRLISTYRKKEKVDIEDLKKKIKTRNDIAKQIDEPDKFTKFIIELQVAGT